MRKIIRRIKFDAAPKLGLGLRIVALLVEEQP
jgi:hypothetical protein